jgi:hypothetical protein
MVQLERLDSSKRFHLIPSKTGKPCPVLHLPTAESLALQRFYANIHNLESQQLLNLIWKPI